MISIMVSLVIINTNLSSNRQYSSRSFETAFELSLFLQAEPPSSVGFESSV